MYSIFRRVIVKVFFKTKPDIFGEWITEWKGKTDPPRIPLDSKYVMDIVFVSSVSGQSVDLSKYKRFMFVLGDDYDQTTPVKLIVDNSNIKQGQYVKSDGTVSENMLSIEIEASSEALHQAIGTKEELPLMFEVTGYTGSNTMPSFIAQGDIVLRNRISLTAPTGVDEDTISVCGMGVCGEMILGTEG